MSHEQAQDCNMPLQTADNTSSILSIVPPAAPPAPCPPSPSLLNMSSFLTNIIDCVARPSTSDSPVRLLKSKYLGGGEGSPVCVSALSSESDNSPLSRTSSLMDGVATACLPVSMAQAIDEDGDSQQTLNSIDQNVRQQFEAAFATFLYKNPAFTTMSHGNLTRLRSKLARDAAKNSAAEADLRRQLGMLKEKKQKTELALQRELLVVTRAKAAREAELQHLISKSRSESMAIDENLRRIKNGTRPTTQHTLLSPQMLPSPVSPLSPGNISYTTISEEDYPMLVMPEINDEDSFQAELKKTRIEYERLSRETGLLQEIIEKSS